MVWNALQVFCFRTIADVRIDVPAVALMLPDATRHRWAFVLADEVIATAMLNAYGWDALETYLPKSVLYSIIGANSTE